VPIASITALRTSAHYDSAYFQYQQSGGEFGGWADVIKFQKYIDLDARVLDFGCGGGFLLESLSCKERHGVEINAAAREAASKRNLKVFASTSEIEDGWADVIISNHALEHCLHPLLELCELRTKLAPGGRIVFVVPGESIRYTYKPNNQAMHLYTWSPMSLGNLFQQAGFEVIESRAYIHGWPPRIHRQIARLGGRRLFELTCRVYGRLTSWGLTPTKLNQVRIVARKAVR
jgi:SAM-dependent methyltransferase